MDLTNFDRGFARPTRIFIEVSHSRGRAARVGSTSLVVRGPLAVAVASFLAQGSLSPPGPNEESSIEGVPVVESQLPVSFS